MRLAGSLGRTRCVKDSDRNRHGLVGNPTKGGVLRVATALIADYAAQTNDGKLIVAGIFDTLFCLGDTPFRHPHMAVAIRIHLHPGEAPKHQIRMKLVDPDGVDTVPELEGEFEVPVVDPTAGA